MASPSAISKGQSSAKPPSEAHYQTLITERSIARAALHLGIETLTEDSISVLSDALTHYIERIGGVLGCNVENGGRSSDHVNVLDALRAVEDCGLRHGGGGMDGTGMNGNGRSTAMAGNTSGGINIGNGEGWLGLANFLYGPGFEDSLSATPNADVSTSASSNGAVMNGHGPGPGPGHGPGNGHSNSNHNQQHHQLHENGDEGEEEEGGWNAPLDDYDSLPNFPVQVVGIHAKAETKNTNFDATDEPFQNLRSFYGDGYNGGDDETSIVKDGSGRGDEKIKEAGDASKATNDAKQTDSGGTKVGGDNSSASNTNADASKQTKGGGSGGGIGSADATKKSPKKTPSTSKRKRDEKDSSPKDPKRTKASHDPSASKNGKNHDNDALSTADGGPEDDNGAGSRSSLPSYIPKFLPVFPPKHTYDRSASSSSAIPTLSDVNMMDNITDRIPPSALLNNGEVEFVRSSLVQLGRQSNSYWGAINMNARAPYSGDNDSVFVKVNTSAVDVEGRTGPQRVVESVKPVVRASNARMSRILEGSMDLHS